MKKKIFGGILLLALTGATFAFSGCKDETPTSGSEGGGDQTKYGVSFVEEALTVYVGAKDEAEYVLADGSANETVSFTSSAPTIVAVAANGMLNALQEGTATITVTSSGGYTNTLTVTVCPAWDDGVMQKAPNCKEQGIVVYTNRVTGETRTEYVDELGHNYVFGKSVAATYEEAAHELWVCTHDERHTEKRNFTGTPLVKETVTAYSLADYAMAKQLSVTFASASHAEADVAMLQLRTAENETAHTLYAAVSENDHTASFDLSGIENIQNYHAVITTQKTATPTITAVQVLYNEHYDLAKIYYDLYTAISLGTMAEGQKLNWGYATINNVKFLFQAVGENRCTMDGKVYYTAPYTAAKTPMNLTFLDSSNIVEVTIEAEIYKKTAKALQIAYSDGSDIFKLTETGKQSKTVQMTEKLASGIRFITYSDTQNDSESWVKLHSLDLVCKAPLTVGTIDNLNGNGAQVSAPNYTTIYDFADVAAADTVEVKFGGEQATASDTATLTLKDSTGATAHTLTAAVESGKASFAVSALGELSGYTATLTTEKNTKPTVVSVTAQHKKTYELPSIYAAMYTAIMAGEASGYDSGVQGSWCQKTIDGVNFVYQAADKTRIDENGNIYYVGTSEAATSSTPIKWTIADAANLKSVALTIGVNEVQGGTNEWQIMSGTELFKVTATGEITQTIEGSALTNGEISCLYWSNVASAAGYGSLGDMVLLYEQTVKANIQIQED